jgi:dihydroneopterin aldolase
MNAVDEITLTGLTVFGYHGVFESERREGQPFIVDLTLFVDTTRAARSDEVTDTVHYGEVAEAVASVVSGEAVNLLETLAARIADVVLAFAGVERVRVCVHKPQAPIALEFADVSVTIERGPAS